MIQRGTIKGFRGSWGSGVGYLIIEDLDTGLVESVPCENGPTVRALEACFGNVIGSGHTVRNDSEAGYIGQEIFWSYDELGLIFGGFTPVDDAEEGVWEIYEGNKKGGTA